MRVYACLQNNNNTTLHVRFQGTKHETKGEMVLFQHAIDYHVHPQRDDGSEHSVRTKPGAQQSPRVDRGQSLARSLTMFGMLIEPARRAGSELKPNQPAYRPETHHRAQKDGQHHNSVRPFSWSRYGRSGAWWSGHYQQRSPWTRHRAGKLRWRYVAATHSSRFPRA